MLKLTVYNYWRDANNYQHEKNTPVLQDTRDVFYVRREVDLMKTAKVNAYIMHIFGKIELLSLHATLNYFKIHYFNAFLEANTYLYIAHWKYGRNVTFYGLSL